jgi:hypothetical protein
VAPASSHGEHNDRHRHTARLPAQTRYRRLYDELLEILIQLDPPGVHSTDRSALAPEVASILARLRKACVADDVERIVLEELRRWYGRRGIATLDRDLLADAAIAICTVWNHFLSDTER